jgi:hypothetical protein
MLQALTTLPYSFWFNINDIRWWTCVKSCEPTPNLSHFTHVCVCATHVRTCTHRHTHTHKHKCIVSTNLYNTVTDCIPTKLVGVLLPEAVLENSCSHCLINSEAHPVKFYVLTGGKADHFPPSNKPHHCSCGYYRNSGSIPGDLTWH